MSLRAFHILLISLSSLLALLFAGWSLQAYRATGRGSDAAFALFSFVLAGALAAYIVWFSRRVRSREDDDRQRRKIIRHLIVGALAWSASARPAAACAVCFGQAEGPMIDAARLGVWLLFGLVLAVQGAFVVFFLYLRKQARASARRFRARAEESTS